jgi:hypothetical protein
MKRTLCCCIFLATGILDLDLDGDDITISCSILHVWMLRLIFDKGSINHNAANTGVLVRRAKT